MFSINTYTDGLIGENKKVKKMSYLTTSMRGRQKKRERRKELEGRANLGQRSTKRKQQFN
jgi:hypothetical protein